MNFFIFLVFFFAQNSSQNSILTIFYLIPFFFCLTFIPPNQKTKNSLRPIFLFIIRLGGFPLTMSLSPSCTRLIITFAPPSISCPLLLSMTPSIIPTFHPLGIIRGPLWHPYLPGKQPPKSPFHKNNNNSHNHNNNNNNSTNSDDHDQNEEELDRIKQLQSSIEVRPGMIEWMTGSRRYGKNGNSGGSSSISSSSMSAGTTNIGRVGTGGMGGGMYGRGRDGDGDVAGIVWENGKIGFFRTS